MAEPHTPSEWGSLVAGLRTGDPAAIARLRAIFIGGIRFFLRRASGRDNPKLEDKILSVVVDTIAELPGRDPDTLVRYVLAVVKQAVKAGGARMKSAADDLDPARAREFLSHLAEIDRAALRQYYVEEAAEDEVCRMLHLTREQFRAIKQNARAAVLADSAK